MQKTISLCENRQFRLLYSKGKSFVYPYFVVYTRPNRLSVNRIGITVSKKVGNAVKRNRAKRVIKEAYRLLEDKIAEGNDFVFVARSRTPFVSMENVKKDMFTAVKRQKLLNCNVDK